MHPPLKKCVTKDAPKKCIPNCCHANTSSYGNEEKRKHFLPKVFSRINKLVFTYVATTLYHQFPEIAIGKSKRVVIDYSFIIFFTSSMLMPCSFAIFARSSYSNFERVTPYPDETLHRTLPYGVVFVSISRFNT